MLVIVWPRYQLLSRSRDKLGLVRYVQAGESPGMHAPTGGVVFVARLVVVGAAASSVRALPAEHAHDRYDFADSCVNRPARSLAAWQSHSVIRSCRGGRATLPIIGIVARPPSGSSGSPSEGPRGVVLRIARCGTAWSMHSWKLQHDF